MLNFQTRVDEWMLSTFGEEVSNDRRERAFRFGEEALELLQAGGLSKVDVLKILRRVYSRPVGRVSQEIGGTMVTLAAFCTAYAWDMEVLADLEQSHCEQPEVTAKILAKQQGKRDELAVPLVDHEVLLMKLMRQALAGHRPDFTEEENVEMNRIFNSN